MKDKVIVKYQIEYSDGHIEIIEAETFHEIYLKGCERAKRLKLSVSFEEIKQCGEIK